MTLTNLGVENASSGSVAPQANGDRTVAVGNKALSNGTESVALGESLASGAQSFAAALANNTTSYGATGSGSIAIGDRNKTTGGYSVNLGRLNTVTGANGAAAIGENCSTSGASAISIGNVNQATGDYSCAIGRYATTGGTYGKFSKANGIFANYGDAQNGWFNLRSDTTDATSEAMTTNNGTASATNQIVVTSDSCMTFTGAIVAMQNGAQSYGSWEIRGLLVNDGGTTTLPIFNISEIGSSGWKINLYADDTNNALKVQVTGEASTNIRWVANIQTAEVNYA